MKVFESKASLVFTIEDILTHQNQVVHAHQMIQYPATRFREQAISELEEQAAYYYSSYHLVEAHWGVRRCQKKI